MNSTPVRAQTRSAVHLGSRVGVNQGKRAVSDEPLVTKVLQYTTRVPETST